MRVPVSGGGIAQRSIVDIFVAGSKAADVSGDVQYAQTGGTYIAFRALGDGPTDVLVVMDGFVPIDAMDDEPRLARSMTRLSSLGRLIRFDRRGIGLSDPVSPSSPPTLEQWVEDAIAVLDAAGSERAIVVAAAEASPVGLLLAAMHPDRTLSVVVVNGYARALADEDYSEGISPTEATESLEATTAVESTETADDFVFVAAPSAARDPLFREWWRQTGRRGASPATAKALLQVALQSDVRSALPLVQAPTLVIHLRDEPLIPVRLGRYIADHIPGARWIELPGADDWWWASDSASLVLDEIEEFVTGVRTAPTATRVLSTILFTDIVSSTAQAAELGDERWRELLDTFDRGVRRQLTRFRGVEVNTTGDGFVVTFDGPARGVACAAAIRDTAHQLGLEVRSGVHTGEIELRGDDISGIGVHIAARIAALAGPSSICVSRTVTDLVVGSGLSFRAAGDHKLKGVPGTWAVYTVSDN